MVKLLQVLAEKLASISPTVDIADVLEQISDLLDRSVKVTARHVSDQRGEYKAGRILDLGNLDFDKLQEQFKKGRKRILAEQLRKAIEVRLHALFMLNKMRINYMEKFQQLIDDYNAGSMNVEEYYRRLLEFVKGLNDEEKRSLSENLTEEELAIYDLLVNPPVKMTQKEVLAVKKIAHVLLDKIKRDKLVLDWRKKQQSRAAVKLCIEETLGELPPAFNDDLYHQKCGLVYQHVYEAYVGCGKSIYE